jgi:hypothetical protein
VSVSAGSSQEPRETVCGQTETVAVTCCDRLLPVAADVPTVVSRESIIEGLLNVAKQPVESTEV